MAYVTKDSLTKLITRDDDVAMHAIGRGLVVLFNNQTSTEQANNVTTNHNTIGFQPMDARQGCITAKYYLKHRKLLDWQIERWLRVNKRGTVRLAKYHRQLNDAAKRKALRRDR